MSNTKNILYPKVDLEPSAQQDRELLAGSASKRFNDVSQIFVRPTVRLGGSGNRIYMVRSEKKSGLKTQYYFAKIGKREDLNNEFNSYTKYVDGILRGFPSAWFYNNTEIKNNQRECCLSYFIVGTEKFSEPITFYDLLTNSIDIPLKKICEAIELIYDSRIEPWIKDGSQVTINWFDCYEKDLRWDKTKCFIKKWYNNSGYQKKNITANNRNFISPLYMLKKIKQEDKRSSVKLRTVHGDLHLRNIILEKINDEYRPWIIDFGWTRKSHCLVDYTKLETSLKIFFFSRYLSEERYIYIHDLLHESNPNPDTDSLSPLESNMIKIISTIRTKAREEVKENNWPYEYYLSALFTSFGITTIKTSSPSIALLTSAWFATQISIIENK